MSSGPWSPRREAIVPGQWGHSMRRLRRCPTASRTVRPCCRPRRARPATLFVPVTRPGARARFDEVVASGTAMADSATALRNLLGPYFHLLARDGTAEGAAAMFRAAQLLQRPRVAQTHAILPPPY